MDMNKIAVMTATENGTLIDAKRTMEQWFDGGNKPEIGADRGADDALGATAVHDVTLDGDVVGQVRDTASGLIYVATEF